MTENEQETEELFPAEPEETIEQPASMAAEPPSAAPQGLPYRLNAAQARVLGALVEKEATTPDYYPLSLNALKNACNQSSNREPVMNLDEEEVRLALRILEERKLAGRARGADGRVTKYEHWLGEAFNFNRAETALICVLLLRGPQTPGELRGRTERIHAFDEIGDVLAGLQKLMERSPALVAVMPRQPGTKESRYVHLLSGPVAGAGPMAAFAPVQPYFAVAPVGYASPASLDAGAEARLAQVEAAMAELRLQMAEMQKRFDDLFA
jgi:uncharacterized protein YceH (UPF0502 family)